MSDRSRSSRASPETILTAERGVASTAARNRGYGTPGAAAGHVCPAAWSLRTASGGNAGDGSGPWADSATVERREAASRLRGTAHASQAWRRALRARLVQGWRLPALRRPSVRGRVRRVRDAERRQTRAQNTRRGKEETALFDIVKTEGRERRIPATGAGVIAAAATHPVSSGGALHRVCTPKCRGRSAARSTCEVMRCRPGTVTNSVFGTVPAQRCTVPR
jgi:hypothetical protein